MQHELFFPEWFLLTDWALIHCLPRAWGLKTEDTGSKASVRRSAGRELRKSWHRSEVTGRGKMEGKGKGKRPTDTGAGKCLAITVIRLVTESIQGDPHGLSTS